MPPVQENLNNQISVYLQSVHVWTLSCSSAVVTNTDEWHRHTCLLPMSHPLIRQQGEWCHCLQSTGVQQRRRSSTAAAFKQLLNTTFGYMFKHTQLFQNWFLAQTTSLNDLQKKRGLFGQTCSKLMVRQLDAINLICNGILFCQMNTILWKKHYTYRYKCSAIKTFEAG